MKTINELRDEYNKMNEQEIQRELLLAQIRIVRSLENIAEEILEIRKHIGNARIY